MRMTRKTFYFIICTLLSLTVSCTNGDLSELLRSYDDPSDETPVADCYSQACTIKLSWQSDECADKYILMRAEDDGAENFRQIYSGSETSYVDRFSQPEDQKRYLYRLDKTRGSKRFSGTDSTCAVVSATLHDTHEPNDVIGKAIEVERIINATMPCSQFKYRGRSYGDEDWYYVRLNPLCTAMITFTQPELNIGVQNTDFLYMELGGSSRTISNGDKILLENTEFSSRNIYFKIVPNIAKKFSGSAGAEVLTYRLELSEVKFR